MVPAYAAGAIPAAAPVQPNAAPAAHPAVADEDWGPFQGAGDPPPAQAAPPIAAANQPAAIPVQPPPVPVAQVHAPPVPVVQAPAPQVQAPQVQAPAQDHGPHVATGDSRLSTEPMHTTQLANCAAVVAHNAATGQARMYHWNTEASMTPVTVDPDDEGDPNAPTMLSPIAERFQEARAAVDAGVPAPRTYHIVPGGMWRQGGMTAQSTQNFRAGLAQHFPGAVIHPTSHSIARWANGQLTGHDAEH